MKKVFRQLFNVRKGRKGSRRKGQALVSFPESNALHSYLQTFMDVDEFTKEVRDLSVIKRLRLKYTLNEYTNAGVIRNDVNLWYGGQRCWKHLIH